MSGVTAQDWEYLSDESQEGIIADQKKLSDLRKKIKRLEKVCETVLKELEIIQPTYPEPVVKVNEIIRKELKR